ncbi:MAG: PEP/pyruvate-binding domain-containing protein, partial [Candidatus Thiodiazotropha sp.]
ESKMIINAASGLGESVVSGKVTPDSIIIKRKDSDIIDIETINCAEKSKHIVPQSETEDVKTLESSTSTNEDSMLLTTEDVYRICQEGIQIERKLNKAQDIEWAMSQQTLYILQARPITKFGMDEDEEIIHEFDSPLVSDNVMLTTANIGEMMPGAVSTLTSDLFVAASDRCIALACCKRLDMRPPVHVTTTAYTFSGIPMINLTYLGASAINFFGGEKNKSDIEIFVVGETVKEHTLEIIRNYYGRQMSVYQIIRKFLVQQLILDKADSKLFDHYEKLADTLTIGEGTKTAKELYDCIDEKLTDYFDMWHAYLYKSGLSGTWSSIIMAMLKGESRDLSTDNLADLASILSECKNVYSAEVPQAIKRLAKLIATSDIKDQFMEMPATECNLLLKNAENKYISAEFGRFLERHGHRGIREAEFLEKSWNQDPTDLMQTLKMIIKHGTFEDNTNAHKTVDEIVKSLKTPLSRFKKFILKSFLVEKAMNGVCSREFGKSVSIKFSDIFKQAYWRLAHMMVHESRVPEPKLLFFLTHSEMGKLLERRSANLIRLAKRRMRVYPKMNETKYPKLNVGLPKPVRKDAQKPIPPSFVLQGMPVCRGRAQGRACVIKSLEDAHQIEEGDILVCKYTDVGWSPYFPLISGLVTELGGLLSHGAVVARECGIPCIVNTPDATDLVKTGDIVLLDATAGRFGKLTE